MGKNTVKWASLDALICAYSFDTESRTVRRRVLAERSRRAKDRERRRSLKVEAILTTYVRKVLRICCSSAQGQVLLMEPDDFCWHDIAAPPFIIEQAINGSTDHLLWTDEWVLPKTTIIRWVNRGEFIDAQGKRFTVYLRKGSCSMCGGDLEESVQNGEKQCPRSMCRVT